MDIRLKNPFGIRAKFVLLSSFLLIIPWLGYQYILAIEEDLRQVQERTVMSTAQAFAIALNERPALFTDEPLSLARRSGKSAATSPPPSPEIDRTPEIDRIVAGMSRHNLHVQVIDLSGRVLLTVGDIQSATGLSLQRVPRLSLSHHEDGGSGFGDFLQNRVLTPVYHLILTRPGNESVDGLYTDGRRDGPHIDSALQGTPMSDIHTVADTETQILEVAHPITAGGEIIGAVVVDQNLSALQVFRHEALETLLTSILGAFLLLVLTQFLFASRIAYRILALRNQAENILDDTGRVENTIIPSRSADEIGDLSRSFSNIVERLTQYTDYLKNLTSRLSHELRTPVAVVRSSLGNLSLSAQDEESAVSIKRAEEGIDRLNLILTNMSESIQLELMLQASEKDKKRIDLTQVVRSCIEGHKLAYPGIDFKVEVGYSPLYILGVAEHIAQLLDKLIANAVEFSEPDEPVTVYCGIFRSFAVLKVTNTGPYLPRHMDGRLFSPMVSVRAPERQKQPHLGIGLYIARLISDFHSGKITAENRKDGRGVVVTLSVPLFNP